MQAKPGAETCSLQTVNQTGSKLQARRHHSSLRHGKIQFESRHAFNLKSGNERFKAYTAT